MGRGTRWSKTRWKEIRAWNVTEGIHVRILFFFLFRISLFLFLLFFFFFHPRQLVSQDFTLQSFTRLETGLLPLHNRCSTFLSRQVKFKVQETCEVEITIYPRSFPARKYRAYCQIFVAIFPLSSSFSLFNHRRGRLCELL